jgi:acyl-coenzyme A synthetase/AMP-(fatty) acid ligase
VAVTPSPDLGAAIADALRGEGVCLEVDGEMLDRATLGRRVSERAADLLDRGVRPDALVWIDAGRGAAFWVDLFAVWWVGAVAVPLPALASTEQLDIIRRMAPPANRLTGGASEAGPSIVATASTRRGRDEPRTLPENARAAVLFTSGSTGMPKGVVLSRRALLGNVRASCAVLPLVAGERLAMAVPFHFTSAICHALAACLAGATLVATERRLFMADLVPFLTAARATAFGGSPVQLDWIARTVRPGDVALRWLMSSGDRLSPETEDRTRRALPAAVIVAAYGITEAGGRLCIRTGPEEPPGGSVGAPIPGMQIEARESDGTRAASGVEGELWVTGPWLADGYLGEPGFDTVKGFASGDLGWVDEQGRVHIAGRVDSVFKVAGQKVHGDRIAEHLRQQPGVIDAAVIGYDDPDLGSIPAAAVCLAPGERFNKGVLLAAVRRAFPPFHVPRIVVTLPALPRTGSGKIDRRALRAAISAAASATRPDDGPLATG